MLITLFMLWVVALIVPATLLGLVVTTQAARGQLHRRSHGMIGG